MRYLAIIGLLAVFSSAPHANEPSKTMTTQQSTLFDFASAESAQSWQIVNDGVMGGLSQSTMTVRENATALFKGKISLENNGGFASVRTVPRLYNLEGYTGITFKVKGDGKRYQFRIRTNNRFDGVAYRAEFDTKAGEWMNITVPFADFVPVFRGRILSNVGAIDPRDILQFGILVTNKKADNFQLEVDWIKAYQN